jgi:hypothetical protein
MLLEQAKMQICRAKILLVLYGCDTWSLTLKEERRLRVFENRILRNVFGPKIQETAERWRNLHNDELRNVETYS